MERTLDLLEVRREIEIAASPETVWELLIDPAKAPTWWGQNATFDLRRGWQVPHGGERREHRERGVHRDRAAAPAGVTRSAGRRAGPGPSYCRQGRARCEIELVPTDTGTLLRLVHWGLPNAEAVTSHGEGWDHYLGRLATVASGGDPGTRSLGARRAVSDRFEHDGEGRSRWVSTCTHTRAGAWPRPRRSGTPRWPQWGAWFGGLGDSVVDMGAPVRRVGRDVGQRLDGQRAVGADRLLGRDGLEPRRRGLQGGRLPDLRERRRRRGVRSARDVAETSSRRGPPARLCRPAHCSARRAYAACLGEVAQQLDDRRRRDRQVLDGDPLAHRVVLVAAGEDVRRRQAHLGQPRAVGAAADRGRASRRARPAVPPRAPRRARGARASSASPMFRY